MLLTHLHETISRRAKTVDELQKLIDVSGSSGIRAVSSDSVEVTDRIVVLQNIITPGRLPFKFEATSTDVTMKVYLPTLKSFHGMEALTVRSFEVGRVSTKDKVGQDKHLSSTATSLAGMPTVTEKTVLNSMLKLENLDGLKLVAGMLELNYCPLVPDLANAAGASKIVLSGCENLSLQHFPHSCQELNISYQTFKRGLPWYITIPPSCKVTLSTSNHLAPFAGNELPLDLAQKIIDYQLAGKSSRTHLLEIQADLIDADFDELAEL